MPRSPLPRSSTELRRAGRLPAEADQPDPSPRDRFWQWVLLAILAHLLFFVGLGLVAWLTSRPAPVPPPAISWLKVGDFSKGTASPTSAPKNSSPSLPRPKPHQVQAPTPRPVAPSPQPKPVLPPKVIPPIPAQLEPPPDLPPLRPVPQPVLKPKVKVDLSDVVTRPDLELPTPPSPTPPAPAPKVDISHDTPVDRPVKLKAEKKPKPKLAVKPTPPSPPEETSTAPSLTPQDVAQKLSESLNHAGVQQAVKIGNSGAVNGSPNDFSSFYTAIRDQVYDTWEQPGALDPTAGSPVVRIHVLPDGTVQAESVTLEHSSGNAELDESALRTARHLGKLRQALPDGCPPDIPITFKLSQ